MTNKEKFKEVFGMELNPEICLVPTMIKCPEGDCDHCKYNNWADEEYTGRGLE